MANRIGREILSGPVPNQGGEDPIGSNPLRVTPVLVNSRPVGLLLVRGTVSDLSVSDSTRWCAGLGGWLDLSPGRALPERASGDMVELRADIFFRSKASSASGFVDSCSAFLLFLAMVKPQGIEKNEFRCITTDINCKRMRLQLLIR